MTGQTSAPWSSSYRLVAAEKWKAKSAAMGSAATLALVEYARPRPGMQVLDIACGTGEPGISLAQRVGPSGQVVGSDLSLELLEIAAQRARSKGLQNFTTQKADAHHLPFPDHRFDLATCRFGVMFFQDPGKALSELHRVLKPDSRACFAVWGTFEQPYWQTTMKIVHRYVGGPLLDPNGADPFRYSQAGSLPGQLRAVGFQDVDESMKNVPWTWRGEAEELFEYACATAAPFRPMLERLPAELWPQVRAEAKAAIEQYRLGDEIRFGADIIFVSGKA
jgi:SAM-dependent methyltransferase